MEETKIMRNGKEVKFIRQCPNCRSRRFTKLETPLHIDNRTIFLKCRGCAYEWSIPDE
jgi:DNA-directed RNA polymerase subunit M/transcription elongation factor TFIIS